jgi:hypothetical protein
MSPMHSVISFMEYLSIWEFWLSSLTSCTMRSPWPCFFGTQKMSELVVGLWNFELLLVNWILCFEVDFVLEILGETQVVLVDAESILLFTQDVQIPFVEFPRNLEVTSSSDFLPGQSSSQFLFTFGKRLWMSWHTDEMKSSVSGTSLSFSVSMTPIMSSRSSVAS